MSFRENVLRRVAGWLDVDLQKMSTPTATENPNNVARSVADLPTQWMSSTLGPGDPIQPLPPSWESEITRDIDYPISVNASLQPRTGYGLMPFGILKDAYEAVTEVRMPTSTIIRELTGFLPRLVDGDGNEDSDHPYNWLTISPDRVTPFSVWLARFLQSKQVYDAGALFILMNGSNLEGLRYVDGSTLFLIVDEHGELPTPRQSDPRVRTSEQYAQKMRKWVEKHPDPAFYKNPVYVDGRQFHDATLAKASDGATILKTPAFAQVIKGVPFGWYSQDEIWYRPALRRTDAPYGTSYIEQSWPWVITIANIVAFELAHYRTGNMPEGWAELPKDMFPNLDRIMAYELAFNQRMSTGSTERMRQRFVPEGTKWHETKKAEFPEKLYERARDNISLLAGVPPSEYGKVPGQGLGGKGFADAMMSALFRMGLMPNKSYVDDAINENLKRAGVTDVSFELSIPTESTDPDKQKTTIKELFAAGLLTLNDALGQMNLGPVPDGDIHIIVSGGTVIVLEDYLKGKRDPPKGVPGAQGAPGVPPAPGATGAQPVATNVAAAATSESKGGGSMTSEDYKIVDKILTTGHLPDHKTYSLPARVPMAKVDATHTDGAMVAVFIPDDVASKLREITESLDLPKEAELETPDNMHITLAFLPDYDAAKENSSRILGCIQAVTLAHEPLKGNVQGFGVFNGQDGMKVLYATLDNPDLPFIRSEICENLDRAGIEYAKDHGFVPHITMAYFPASFELPAGFAVPDMPAEIDGVTLALGDALTTITLQAGETRLGKGEELEALQKHCGVCPEDDDYYQAPIAREVTFDFPNGNHVNDVEIVAMVPDGLVPKAALWKPQGGEDEALVAKIGGPQYVREEAAYLLDRSLRFFLVPVAYVADVSDEEGAALYYVMGSDPADDLSNYDPAWIERAAVLDFVMQNIDRHAGNFLTHPDDPTRPVMIDNGLGFPSEDLYFRSPFVDMMNGKPLSSDVMTAIKGCSKDAATWTDIQDLVGSVAGDLAYERLVELLENGVISTGTGETVQVGTGVDPSGDINEEGQELSGEVEKVVKDKPKRKRIFGAGVGRVQKKDVPKKP